MYLYILNTHAHMYIVRTLSVKNVGMGNSRRQMRMIVGRGAQYPKEGESWG